MNLKSKQHGDSMIEAMVAIFILSFGVLVLMLAQLGSVNSVLDARNQSEIAQAADNYAERLAATPTLKVQEDTAGNKAYLTQTYTKTGDCTAALGVTLNNVTVTKCTVSANGAIQIKWGAQDAKDNTGFTYNLSAGNTSGSTP